MIEKAAEWFQTCLHEWSTENFQIKTSTQEQYRDRLSHFLAGVRWAIGNAPPNPQCSGRVALFVKTKDLPKWKPKTIIGDT